jgi:hypothetical protein
MKIIKSVAAALALAGLTGTAANGAILVNESFTYANGNIVGQDPAVGTVWAAHSGAAATPVQVTGGAIVLAQGAGSREDVNIGFEGGEIASAGETFYAAYDLTVPDPGAAIVDVNFAEFLAGTTTFDARVWVTAPTTAGYRLAVSNDSSITDADGEVRTADLAFGTTYRVVTSYNFDTKQSSIWINPTLSTPALTATDPGFSDPVTAYAFRQAAGNTGQTIDNLIVSTSPEDVGVSVPEPTGLALIGLGSLYVLRRRRAC